MGGGAGDQWSGLSAYPTLVRWSCDWSPSTARRRGSQAVRCVGPGDIVVSKIAPVRAAIVTPNIFRHPVDANCYLVRGLDLAMGFWFALCINQPAFGEYLVRKSGAAIVPRVRADVLGSVRLPRPPAGIEAISRRVYGCIEQRLDNQVELFRFLATVRHEVASSLPTSVAEDDENETVARRGIAFSNPQILTIHWSPATSPSTVISDG